MLSSKKPRIKKINGQNYHLHSIHTTKFKANKQAVVMEKQEYTIRIIKSNSDYYIWSRR